MKSLNNLPKPVQEYFNNTYSKVKDRPNAKKIAWALTKCKLHKESNTYIGKTKDFEVYKTVVYKFKPQELHIAKALDDLVYVDYTISSNDEDEEGQSFTDFALSLFQDQINNEGLIGYLPDNGHEILKMAKANGMTPDEIEEYVKSLNTGIKAISANYNQGKLVATIEMPKNMFDYVKDMGVSIEARIPESAYKGNKFHQGRLTSFIFTNKPANTSTGLNA